MLPRPGAGRLVSGSGLVGLQFEQFHLALDISQQFFHDVITPFGCHDWLCFSPFAISSPSLVFQTSFAWDMQLSSRASSARAATVLCSVLPSKTVVLVTLLVNPFSFSMVDYLIRHVAIDC